MICGKGGLDFCLKGTDGFMCVWEGEGWKRNRLRGGNISFYLFIFYVGLVRLGKISETEAGVEYRCQARYRL